MSTTIGSNFVIMNKETDVKGTPLKKRIKDKNMTHKELAKRLGCAYSMIGFYIRGEKQPSVNMFFKICQILEVKPTELAQDFGIDIKGIPD